MKKNKTKPGRKTKYIPALRNVDVSKKGKGVEINGYDTTINGLKVPKVKHENACVFIQTQVLFSFKWNMVESLLESQGGFKIATKAKTAN